MEMHLVHSIQVVDQPMYNAKQIIVRLKSGTKFCVVVTNEFMYHLNETEQLSYIVSQISEFVYKQAKEEIGYVISVNEKLKNALLGKKMNSIKDIYNGFDAKYVVMDEINTFASGGTIQWPDNYGKYCGPCSGLPGKHTCGPVASFDPATHTTSYSPPEPTLSAPMELFEKVKGLKETVKCPLCARLDSCWQTIQHINDIHGWTREQIADWLETLDIDITIGEKK